MSKTSLSCLSDRELLSQLQLLTHRERVTTIDILKHLNEVERRRLHVKQGFSSMFDYCTRSLRYSASAAARRIRTARCLRRHPALEGMLSRREVSLSTVSLVAPFLNEDNARGLLRRIRDKSQREVESIAAEYRPPLRFRDRVRPVRVVGSVGARGARADDDGKPPLAEASVATGTVPDPCTSENRTSISEYCRSGSDPARASVDSASNAKREATIEKKLLIQFLASEAFMKRYEEVRALLGHRIPAAASFEDIFGIMIAEFVERHSPERKAQRREARAAASNGKKGRPKARTTRRSRHVPASTRDAVIVRDDGRCTFVARDGTRCQSRVHLEIDHVRPFSLGGRHHASNLRLLCAAHNRLEAEQVLGGDTMRRFRRRE